ncbi:LysR family transcriptional regulator [Paraburkholderia sp. ZP32-5]|uniref:LysR family transcriptional regulator n=1 Tax=Paraburkholderia sp. ZP32-5 TaxID=2883245 RepID=UPI001F1BE46D|nr:LysR substrate-binding domain-containing protein [Paraburkholderia sp. ZP32-5]
MDLKRLEYFLQVAESRSLSRAGERLGISQPSLSRQIGLLEQELGQHLLVRNGRGVEPTEAGLRLMEHARALLALAARAKEDLQTFQRAPTGKVVVGLPPRIARVLTSSLVQRFGERFPDASISVAEGLSTSMREWLLAGRVELALLYDPPASPQLAFESLFREDLVLVTATSGRLRLPARVKVDDLERYPLILPSQPNAIRSLVEKVCRSRGVHPNVVAEVDAVETITELAAQGYACAILPRSAVRGPQMESSLAIGTLVSPGIKNDLVLATPRSRPMTQLALGCAELIRTLDIGKLFKPTRSARGGATHGAQ